MLLSSMNKSNCQTNERTNERCLTFSSNKHCGYNGVFSLLSFCTFSFYLTLTLCTSFLVLCSLIMSFLSVLIFVSLFSLNVDGCFQFFLLHLLFYLLLPYPSFRPNSLFNFCSCIFYKLCTLSLSLNCFLSVCHSLSFSLSPFLLYSSHFSIFYPPTMNRKALNVF
jgi:hypothetical protein